MPKVRELLAGEGEYRVRGAEVGGAVRVQSITVRVEGRIASAHAVCLGWKGGLRSAIVCLAETIS